VLDSLVEGHIVRRIPHYVVNDSVLDSLVKGHIVRRVLHYVVNGCLKELLG